MSDQPDDTSAEIDLRRYGRRLAARWWIVALCVVIAVAVSLLRSESGNAPNLSEARAFVSIGQPLSPNGVPIPGSLNANPLYPSTLLAQPTWRDAATEAAGLRRGALAGRVSTPAAGASAARAGTSQQLFVTVRGPFEPDQAAAAANALASRLVEFTSRYQESKITRLTARIAGLTRQVQELTTDSAAIRDRIRSLQDAEGRQDTDRAILLTSLGQTLATTRALQADLQEQLFDNEQQLEATRQIERSQVVDEAVGRRLGGAASGRSGLVVAVVLGLVVGVLLALLSTVVRPLRT